VALSWYIDGFVDEEDSVQVSGLDHEALYYQDLDDFLAKTTAFVREGVEEGEPVLVAVPEPRLSALRHEHRDEPVRFLDMTEVGRNPNRLMPWVLMEFVRKHEPQRVRIVGEPIYIGRSKEEIELAVQHEALINLALAGADAGILCPYDVRLAEILSYADQTHPTVLDERGRRPSPGYRNPYRVVSALNRPLPERMVVDEVLVFDRERLARVRSAVSEHATAAGLSPDRVHDVRLAVSEICANAILYGQPGLATLRMWTDDDRVVYEVRSGGHITDPLAGRVVPPPTAPGGRGLLIANRVCDLVQTYSVPEGTVTRLHMFLSPS